MKMNNKGFLLVESLVVSTFVLTVLMLLYLQFNNLMTNHKKSYTYNSVENIYNLGSMADFLKNTGQDVALKNNLGNNKYIVLYNDSNCVNLPNSTTILTCNNLAANMNLKYMIYTDSDVSSLKNYVKNSNDALKQDMKDFITKMDATKIEGKGRLIAKFGDSVNEVSSNDKFATVAIDTNTSSDYNISNVLYSFYKFNDMNVWKYIQSNAADKSLDSYARGSFTIKSFNEGNGLNEIEVKTVGVWEHVYIPLTTEPNKNYTIAFDYQVLESYTNLSGNDSVKLQILSNIPVNSNCENLEIESIDLGNTLMNNSQPKEITFTASSTTTYLTLNFGWAADNQTVKMRIGNFRVQKQLTNETNYGNQLGIGIPNFGGWYTEKNGGTKIDPNTNRYTKEDQVLYARMN